jgi:thiamine biosynthesis lipoprotein
MNGRHTRGVNRFESMGCEVVVEGASDDEVRQVRELFEEHDAIFSRFRSDSELNRVNAAGAATLVSPLFAQMVSVALHACEETGGFVDPTLGGALEAAGYDRDFAALSPCAEAAGPPRPGRPDAVMLIGRVLALHGGVRLDLNGVVKASAVDDALRLLSGPGFVSAGGDVAVRGATDVALPGGGVVRLIAGGLATSGRTKRRWLRAGEEQHHLIDPATGRPAESPWDEVTVCGATCLAADVAAKAAFLLGEHGPDWLDECRLPGRFGAGGRIHENASWLAQDSGVAEGVPAGLWPDADAVRAGSHGDLRQQPPVASVDRVDDVVPAA